jgi:hypothetical protein
MRDSKFPFQVQIMRICPFKQDFNKLPFRIHQTVKIANKTENACGKERKFYFSESSPKNLNRDFVRVCYIVCLPS